MMASEKTQNTLTHVKNAQKVASFFEDEEVGSYILCAFILQVAYYWFLCLSAADHECRRV